MGIPELLLLSLIGLSLGFFVSSGAAALMIGLGIIPRYAGITRTADHVEWYENVCMLGVFLGSLACLYDGNLPFDVPGLAVYGLFSGIFLGSWIIALGEVVNVYAIAMRRLGIVRGIQYLILAMAAGKLLGSLLYFYRGW